MPFQVLVRSKLLLTKRTCRFSQSRWRVNVQFMLCQITFPLKSFSAIWTLEFWSSFVQCFNMPFQRIFSFENLVANMAAKFSITSMGIFQMGCQINLSFESFVALVALNVARFCRVSVYHVVLKTEKPEMIEKWLGITRKWLGITRKWWSEEISNKWDRSFFVVFGWEELGVQNTGIKALEKSPSEAYYRPRHSTWSQLSREKRILKIGPQTQKLWNFIHV